MIFFLCRTGCRETSALQWHVINLDLRQATIRRGIVRGRLTTTKTEKTRKIDLTPSLVSELRKLKLQSQGKGKWVFQNKVGNHVDMDNFRDRVWYPTLKKNELRRIRLHDLRHSYSTFLIRKTKDIYYAQKQLGHHSIQVTVDRYGHLLEDTSETRLVDVLDLAAAK